MRMWGWREATTVAIAPTTIYTTVALVRAIAVRDPANTAATLASLSDDQLQEAINDAGSQVDSALGFTFPTPFSAPVPRQIALLTRDIAVYLADWTYRQFKDYAPGNPIVLRYQRAIKLLEELRAGHAKLIDWPPPGDVIDQPAPEGGTVLNDGYVGVATDLIQGIPTNESPHLGQQWNGPGSAENWGRWW